MGALVLAIVDRTVSIVHVLVAAGIGYVVGKAIRKATDECYARRCHVLAVALTCSGIGLFIPGCGMYKAWEITGHGVTYALEGPYRVGSGPIAPAG